MTTANEIMGASSNANDAMTRAEKLTDNIDQNWEHCATFYQFEDESVLIVCESGVGAFSSRDEANKDLARKD